MSDLQTQKGAPDTAGMDTGTVGEDPSFQFRELAGIVLHYKWLVMATTLVALGGSILHASRHVSLFQAKATLVIERSAPKVLNNVNEVSEMGSDSDGMAYYMTQYKILASYALIGETVARLARGREPDFAQIEAAKDAIQIVPATGSHVVTIIATDRDPGHAALLANTLADVYIERNLAQKTEASSTALSWLELQSVELQAKLRESEQALHQFKRTNNVLAVSMSPQEGQNLLAMDLTAVVNALSSARIKRMNLSAQVAELEAAIKTPGGEQ